MAQIIDGKALAGVVRANVASEVAQIKAQGGCVRFAAVLVGEDPASQIYVRNKQRACEKVGIEFELHTLPATCQYQDLVNLICRLSADKKINGVLLQLPVPLNVIGNHLTEVLNLIDHKKMWTAWRLQTWENWQVAMIAWYRVRHKACCTRLTACVQIWWEKTWSWLGAAGLWDVQPVCY